MSTAQSNINEILPTFYSTLDEHKFFSKLSRHLSFIESDHYSVDLFRYDDSYITISEDHIELKSKRIQNLGPSNYVQRSKTPYFSNSIDTDPVFVNFRKENIKKQLIIPIEVEGIVISVINFYRKEDKENFNYDDISNVQSFLKEITKPLMNIKMYITAKSLNESFQRKIEDIKLGLEEKKIALRVERYLASEDEIIGRSEKMGKAVYTGDKVAELECPVLIQGERGTGKEIIAKRIHCRSNRGAKYFVVFDCHHFLEDKQEENLFGLEEEKNERIELKEGLLEIADGGTLFIKNIDKLGITTQGLLLKFLKEKIATRKDSQSVFASNVRIIVSASESIGNMVKDGRFREDLYYQLNSILIEVPALRERDEDIIHIANYYIKKISPIKREFSSKALALLKSYSWPSNIRELKSIVERVSVLSSAVVIDENMIKSSTNGSEKKEKIQENKSWDDFQDYTLGELEKAHIQRGLICMNGNKTKVAKTLGVTVKTLYNKLNSYSMQDKKKESSSLLVQ